MLSNLFATAVFVEGGRRQLTGQPPVPDLWRGAAGTRTFLDPADGGYGPVALYAIGIFVLFLGVTWVVATVGPALRALRRDP